MAMVLGVGGQGTSLDLGVVFLCSIGLRVGRIPARTWADEKNTLKVVRVKAGTLSKTTVYSLVL